MADKRTNSGWMNGVRFSAACGTPRSITPPSQCPRALSAAARNISTTRAIAAAISPATPYKAHLAASSGHRAQGLLSALTSSPLRIHIIGLPHALRHWAQRRDAFGYGAHDGLRNPNRPCLQGFSTSRVKPVGVSVWAPASDSPIPCVEGLCKRRYFMKFVPNFTGAKQGVERIEVRFVVRNSPEVRTVSDGLPGGAPWNGQVRLVRNPFALSRGVEGGLRWSGSASASLLAGDAAGPCTIRLVGRG